MAPDPGSSRKLFVAAFFVLESDLVRSAAGLVVVLHAVVGGAAVASCAVVLLVVVGGAAVASCAVAGLAVASCAVAGAAVVLPGRQGRFALASTRLSRRAFMLVPPLHSQLAGVSPHGMPMVPNAMGPAPGPRCTVATTGRWCGISSHPSAQRVLTPSRPPSMALPAVGSLRAGVSLPGTRMAPDETTRRRVWLSTLVTTG